MEKASDFDSYISAGVPLARRDGKKVYRSRAQRISTHAPLARRDANEVLKQAGYSISTHAPLARRDLCAGCLSMRK